MNLAQLTTLRVGGPASDVTTARTTEDLVAFCNDHLVSDPAENTVNQPALFIGGGSNLVIADAGFTGPVCLVRTQGLDVTEVASGDLGPVDPHGAVAVTAQAGMNWDEFVAFTVDAGLAGLEALSGIPGSVGATPVQNVGAYGAEVAHVIRSVTVCDRVTGQVERRAPAELEFGYRTSVLKTSAARLGQPRYVVCEVEFLLQRTGESLPVRYAQLAQALGVNVGQSAPQRDVRSAVLELRASKGMVLDPGDHDTWSAGSFFTNPILAVGSGDGPQVPEGAPTYPVVDPVTGEVDASVTKTSAAWLIEHAGFRKGFGLSERASLSTKHTLALTNRGGATAADIVELARHIQAGVREAYGITLHPEPNLVGLTL